MIKDSILKKVDWRCVDCGASVGKENFSCIKCNRKYIENLGILEALPSKMNDLSSKEAHYHDHFEEDPIEVHQLNSFRNYFYHNLIWKKINSLESGAKILEIGSGSGFDAGHLKNDLNLFLSDISSQTLIKTAESLKNNNVICVAADGLNLPFENSSFDTVYTIATFHHFDDPFLALKEFGRVLKKDGLLIIGIEPNHFYFSLVKRFREFLLRITKMKGVDVSVADAEMEGFRYSDWKKFFNDQEWSGLEILPMWFFSGIWHYCSELLFRVFRMRNRLKLFVFLEKMMVFMDQAIMKIPFLDRLSWHFVIFVRKK